MLKGKTRFLAFFMAFAMLLGLVPQNVYGASVSENMPETQTEEIEKTGDVESFGEDGKLDYLYLENKYVASPGSQTVLVGYGEEDTLVEEGVLTVENYRTKEQRTYASRETFQNTVLFELPFTEEDKGIYEVKAVTVTTADGGKTEISLSDTGMERVYFGVDEEVVETEAESDLLTEEAAADFDYSDVEMQIVSFTGDENQKTRIAGDEIAAAMANGDALFKERAGVLQTEANGNVVVVLDPGHDGTHVGTRANGLKEEELTLKIAQYCKAELEQYTDVTVYMTREGSGCPYPGTSSTVCNANRVNAAARVGADYFVSLHLNYASATSAKGSEVYYPNSNYNASIGADGANLAKNISRQLAVLGLNNRGIKIRNYGDGTKYPDGSLADYYGVIRRSKEAGITAVIVEHAFVSNSSDAAFLSDENNIRKLGIADATGIAGYLGLTKGKPVDRGQVEAYVTRLYRLCLGREPDTAGLQDWTDRMCDGRVTGAVAAQGFFFSAEFKNRNYSNEEFVELLYNVMMNRASDYSGKIDWVYKLNNGVGREGVFKGFSDSTEFDNICNSYGIQRGTITVSQGRDRKPGLTTFVSRLYTKALGREYDVDGLNDWCNRICDKKWTVMDVATTGFFYSDEFLNKRLTNGEYIKVLYRTFFDREYDQDGYRYWLNRLNAGVSRREVLGGFANSAEFANLMASYGL